MGKHTTGGGRRVVSAKTAATTRSDTLGGRIQVIEGEWTRDVWREGQRPRMETAIRKLDKELGVRYAFFNRNGSLDIQFNGVMTKGNMTRIKRLAGKGWRVTRSDDPTRSNTDPNANGTVVRIDIR